MSTSRIRVSNHGTCRSRVSADEELRLDSQTEPSHLDLQPRTQLQKSDGARIAGTRDLDPPSNASKARWLGEGERVGTVRSTKCW